MYYICYANMYVSKHIFSVNFVIICTHGICNQLKQTSFQTHPHTFFKRKKWQFLSFYFVSKRKAIIWLTDF